MFFIVFLVLQDYAFFFGFCRLVNSLFLFFLGFCRLVNSLFLFFFGISGFLFQPRKLANWAQIVRQLLRVQVAARGKTASMASVTTCSAGDSWQSCKQAWIPLVFFHIVGSLKSTVLTRKDGKEEKQRGNVSV